MHHDVTYWEPVLEIHNAQLHAENDADIVIIGGGMAGFGTAFHLLKSDPQLDLLVLEARYAGFGASGRNAGMIEAPLLIPLWMFSGSLPEKEALWALNCLHRRTDQELRLLAQACPRSELLPARTLVGAHSRLMLEALRHAHLRLEEAGVPSGMVTAGDVASLCGSHACGAIDLAGYVANPLALTQDLAQAVIAAGGRVVANARVTRVAPIGRERFEISTQSGSLIRARKVIVCTGAWTNELSLPRAPKIHPIATYIMASEPLAEPQLAKLGGDGCCISELPQASYRRLHRRRLLFGGTGTLLKKAETTPETDIRLVRILHGRFQASLPWLREIPFEKSWGGSTCSTSRGVPVIAADAQHPGLFYNCGFQAFLPAILSGSMIKGLVLGKSHLDEEAERLRLAITASRIPLWGMVTTGLRLLYRSLFRKSV